MPNLLILAFFLFLPTHQPLSLSHAAARHEYDYDLLGRRTSAVVKNASATILHEETWHYDTRGHFESHESSNGTLNYAYDDAGNLLAAKSDTPGGYDHTYEYDDANRLDKVWLGQEGIDPLAREIAGYGYNKNGSLEAVGYANGVTHSYAYDNRNRLTALGVNDMVANTTLQGYTYTLDNVGNRTNIAEASGRSITHIFDALHRLRSETIAVTGANPSGATSYALDAVGNRLSRSSNLPGVTARTHTYSSDDHLEADTTDDNGNTLQSQVQSTTGILPVPEPPPGGTPANNTVSATDTYDFENRLIRRVRADGLSIELTYNADGVRVAKETRQGALLLAQTRWLVDSNNLTGYSQVVEVKDGADHLLERRSIGHDIIAFERFDNTGTSLGETYLHYDGLGSVRGLSNATGSLSDTLDYDAFGVIIARTGSTPCNLGYCGEEYDGDLGMVYLRARYMNPDTGRFHTMDTYEGRGGEPLSLHKYLYVHANPVMGTDPSGMFSASQGYAVEDEIRRQYMAEYPYPDGEPYRHGRITKLGDRVTQALGGVFYLKPDIFDTQRKIWMEVKPYSISGIAGASLQHGIYTIGFQSYGYLPDPVWTPSENPITAGTKGETFYVFNVGGILFYTDVKENYEDAIALSLIALNQSAKASLIRNLARSSPAVVSRVNSAATLRYAITMANAAARSTIQMITQVLGPAVSARRL